MTDGLKPGFWRDVIAARRIAQKRGVELPAITREPFDMSKLKYGNTPQYRRMVTLVEQREAARRAGRPD